MKQENKGLSFSENVSIDNFPFNHKFWENYLLYVQSMSSTPFGGKYRSATAPLVM